MSEQEHKVESKARAGPSKAFLQQARAMIIKHRASKGDPTAATSSSTASAAKAKKFNFNLMLELAKSSSRADEDLKENDNSNKEIKPVRVESPWAKSELGVMTEKNPCVYDYEDPYFQKFVDPGYIKEYCTLALEKYNNEKGTNYRYVRVLRAHEGGKTRDTIFTFTFRASQSDSDSDSETFRTKFTSGLRFSEGKRLVVKEVQQVSRVLGARQFW